MLRVNKNLDRRQDSVKSKTINLDVRLGVVNVDVMAIPCTIHHHKRDGKAVMLDEG